MTITRSACPTFPHQPENLNTRLRKCGRRAMLRGVSYSGVPTVAWNPNASPQPLSRSLLAMHFFIRHITPHCSDCIDYLAKRAVRIILAYFLRDAPKQTNALKDRFRARDVAAVSPLPRTPARRAHSSMASFARTHINNWHRNNLAWGRLPLLLSCAPPNLGLT